MPSSLLLAVIVESVLAVVDGRPLMLSEVRLVQALRGVEEGPALEAVIDERLMFREAARLPQAAVTLEEEERAYTSLRERMTGAVSEEALRRLARRQTAIVKYIDFRFRPQIRVTDEAVKTAYEAEYGGRADAPELAAVQEALRERLVSRALDEKIEAWVKELRAAAEVQYNRSEAGGS
jgi:hypothetical protein